MLFHYLPRLSLELSNNGQPKLVPDSGDIRLGKILLTASRSKIGLNVGVGCRLAILNTNGKPHKIRESGDI